MDLPDRWPPRRTSRRRFQEWVKQEVFRRSAEELAADLHEQGGTDIQRFFRTSDGWFSI